MKNQRLTLLTLLLAFCQLLLAQDQLLRMPGLEKPVEIIVDTGDWDACLGTNTPGQSGDLDHRHYRDLFDIWARDQFFPVFYSREKVERVKDQTIRLNPK